MPNLDFSDVINDPDLCDEFRVIRRSETVSDKGRSQVTEATLGPFTGICTFGTGGNRRDDDAQGDTRTLNVITQFRLRSAAEGSQPDVVLYDGARYTVGKVEPWHRFGRGFVNAQAQLQQASVPHLQG